MKKLQFLILISTLTASANGEISIDLGGWSRHFYEIPEKVSDTLSYNEDHDLIGIRYTTTKDKIKYSAAANFMNDSFGYDSFMIAGGAYIATQPSPNTYIDIGGIFGLQYRSWYTIIDKNHVKFDKTIVPLIAPEIIVGYKKVYTSFIVAPNVSKRNGKYKLTEPTLFLQIGIKLT